MSDTNNNKFNINNLSELEKKIALQILKELSLNGTSDKLNQLKYSDYEEIPVDVETFLTDKRYLGNGLINSEGKFTVFPYWVKTLKKIFPNNIDTSYNTLILTGGIGLGKSFMAVLCMLYLLYRMICLKDPYLYYGLQPIDKITFSLMNVTIDAAKGVAWDKMQLLLQSSPWFMEHGTMSGRTEPIWNPPKKIELQVGSSNNSIIGRAVFCLDGDTIIRTTIGDRELKSLQGIDILVVSIDEFGNQVISDKCRVLPTVKTNEEYQIELEDGTIIKCTSNHKLMLKDGTYKEAQFLTEEDELADIQKEDVESYDDFINNIIQSRGQWNIPEGECFEIHHIVPLCKGGEGIIRKGNKIQKHPNLIYLYPEEHYKAHKLLALENPKDAKLVWAWYAMASKELKGRTYIINEEDYGTLKRLHKESIKDFPYGIDPKTGEGYAKGRPMSQSARLKIGEMNKGRLKGIPKSDITKKRMKASWVNRDKSYLLGINKGKKNFTNGKINLKLNPEKENIPEGFYPGLTTKGDTTNYYKAWTKERRQELAKRFSGANSPTYRNSSLNAGGKNGNAKYTYIYEGKIYYCRKDLTEYLRNYYPMITDITIKLIMDNNYTSIIANKYKEVINKLSWRLKTDEDKINQKSNL